MEPVNRNFLEKGGFLKKEGVLSQPPRPAYGVEIFTIPHYSGLPGSPLKPTQIMRASQKLKFLDNLPRSSDFFDFFLKIFLTNGESCA
jgi:hypothetical protein